MDDDNLVPIGTPSETAAFSGDRTISGAPILPIDRIRVFHSTDWEKFIEEWATTLTEYIAIERPAGAGDQGRDVVAWVDRDTKVWDAYQCKHYDRPLRPSDIWVELGKLAYYTFSGAYSIPRKYRFVAPQGCGTSLIDLLNDANKLLAGLHENWPSHCEKAISKRKSIVLEGDLRAHVDNYPWGSVSHIPPLRLLDDHSRTRWHTYRFGGGLPERPAPDLPPAVVETAEARYVRALLDAYSDHIGQPIGLPAELEGQPKLLEHFQDCRVEFFSAESLERFSRDSLPAGSYALLKDEVETGIKDDIRASHSDGYARLLAVVKTARTLQLTAHPLVQRLHIRDRGGICHQLANDGRASWT